jgi:hypothetical protein
VVDAVDAGETGGTGAAAGGGRHAAVSDRRDRANSAADDIRDLLGPRDSGLCLGLYPCPCCHGLFVLGL